MGRDTNDNRVSRIVLGVALFATVFLLPWYVPLALALYGAYRYERYAEMLFAAVVFDALYGAAAGTFYGHAALLSMLVVYVAAVPLRKHLLFSR